MTFFSSTSTPAKPHHESFKIKRGKSNRMGNWERFGAFNQDHQSSPVYKSQRQAWNQDRGSGQNFQPRGKEKYLFIRVTTPITDPIFFPSLIN